MSEIKRTFHKKGNVVEVHATIDKEELTSKDVLNTITQMEQELQKIQTQRDQIKKQSEQMDKAEAHTKELLKDIGKFKDWANEVQEAKTKAILTEIKDECIKAIKDSYVPDSELDEEQNKKRMYLQLQNSLASHERIRTEVVNQYMQKLVFTEPFIKNPFL